MSQADLPGGEGGRGGRQPGRQRGAVEPDPRADLLGGDHPSAGLEPLPAGEVAQRRDRRSVATLDERPAPL
jgi:hypothetical protein